MKHLEIKNFTKYKLLMIITFLFVELFGIYFLENKIEQLPEIFCLYRYIIYFLIFLIVISNIIFEPKKLWDFIFRWRYIILSILFVVLVLLEVNTSSIGIYSKTVQPNCRTQFDWPIWGTALNCRADEYLANTPTLLSQAYLGQFLSTNENIMAANGPVLLFPKVESWNISILASPDLWGFLFLDTSKAMSFHCLLPFFISFLGSFELLLKLTNNKKMLSLTGTLMLVFSPMTIWWNAQNYFSYGFICVILFDKLLIEKIFWRKILYSILLGWMASCFAILLYPAWQIPFTYMYLAILVCVIINDKKNIQIKNGFYILISLLFCFIIVTPAIVESLDVIKKMSETVYPGKRDSSGGTGLELLFQWFPSIIYGIKTPTNPCEYSQILCLYPVPIILGLMQLIKNFVNKSLDIKLSALLIATLFLNVWNFLNIGIFSKITLLYMSTPERSQVVVAALNVVILIYLLSEYNNTKIRVNYLFYGIILSALVIILCVYFKDKFVTNIITAKWTILLSIMYSVLIILASLNNTKLNNLFSFLNIGLAIIITLTIVPVSVGISAINEKPLSKEITKIIEEDKNGIWISLNSGIQYSEFALANGAKVLNSVNFYPQLDVWHKIDKDLKYESIYNRFAHITFRLTNEETSFTLNQEDYFTVNINSRDLKRLNISYIISEDHELTQYSSENVVIKTLYDYDGSTIYKVNF